MGSVLLTVTTLKHREILSCVPSAMVGSHLTGAKREDKVDEHIHWDDSCREVLGAPSDYIHCDVGLQLQLCLDPLHYLNVVDLEVGAGLEANS